MTEETKKAQIYHDAYGSYTSSPPLPPVPPFPCHTDPSCTAANRVCDKHKRVLYVKTIAGETFEIPYGNWENWLWYKQHISEHKGIPLEDIRLIFAGTDREDLKRHSGLQYGSTIHMVLRKRADDPPETS
ncbi:unnamed protein product [Adineta ricciae]|uniref:Ubiquitin-like domain-containing protein n=1 Tax=Adineta ricciae TaxID=249248 RepID=A0A814LCY6_ADIRI|nr:unnamed protein product [Adineta ricciae]CAF1237744.1 unnamed protein product [Adineta ricciae]